MTHFLHRFASQKYEKLHSSSKAQAKQAILLWSHPGNIEGNVLKFPLPLQNTQACAWDEELEHGKFAVGKDL